MGEACKPEKNIQTLKYGGCSIVLRETCALNKNHWHHEERTICRNTEATSHDISQELKLEHKWVLQMDNDPKHTTKLVSKWLKNNNKWSGRHKVLILFVCGQSQKGGL